PMMSDSFMIRRSWPSIFTSVPDHLPNSTRSPTLRSLGMSLPASSRPPGPTAVISPCDGFSFAVWGMKMPPADFSSASMRLTTTRSCSGRNFIAVSSNPDGSFGFLECAGRRCAAGQRIFVALVQSDNSVTVEDLRVDFQARVRKKPGRELLDRETEGTRGAGEASGAGGSPPKLSACGGEQRHLAPAGKQLGHCAVVERGHCGLRCRQRRTRLADREGRDRREGDPAPSRRA